MKKLLIIILLMLGGISASAQVTCNVRIGAGPVSVIGGGWSYRHSYCAGGPAGQIQVNIPFSKTSTWTFSPSIIVAGGFVHDTSLHIYVPLEFGKKRALGYKKIFFPKFGIVFGGQLNKSVGPQFLFGPSVSLDFEINHFVMGMNGYFSPVGYVAGAGLFTFGYKF